MMPTISDYHDDGEVLIEVSGLRKDFETRGATTRALDELDLEVRRGEFLALLGPSGCGKTTLLRCLAGLERPSHGCVKLEGKEILEPSSTASVVFQEPVLLPWRSILGNVVLPAEIRHDDLRRAHQRGAELLETVGLGEFAGYRPRELSGGMRQRASIVRALMTDPHVLLMDEPFGALDAITRLELNELLFSLWRESDKTVVFVTHDIHEAVRLSTRIALMAPRPGRIVGDWDVSLPVSDFRARLASDDYAAISHRLETQIMRMLQPIREASTPLGIV